MPVSFWNGSMTLVCQLVMNEPPLIDRTTSLLLEAARAGRGIIVPATGGSAAAMTPAEAPRRNPRRDSDGWGSAGVCATAGAPVRRKGGFIRGAPSRLQKPVSPSSLHSIRL